MRSLLVALCLLVSIPARAGTIVVMTERSGELGAALEVALANRRVEVARMGSPEGDLRLQRAANAQRAALDAGADAAVWIDQDDVCAVSSDGRVFRHAPLAEASPRMFAAVATSLLDELLAPPELGVHVDVNVTVNGLPVAGEPAPVATNVGGPGARVAILDPNGMPVTVDRFERPSGPLRPRANRTIFEIGPMVSPLSIGLEGDLMFPLADDWRIGVMGSASMLPDDDNALLVAAAGELRCVVSRHLDFGFQGGYAIALDDGVVFAGMRFNIAWEREHSGSALSIVPVLVFTGSGGDPVIPGVYASWRKGFAF